MTTHVTSVCNNPELQLYRRLESKSKYKQLKYWFRGTDFSKTRTVDRMMCYMCCRNMNAPVLCSTLIWNMTTKLGAAEGGQILTEKNDDGVNVSPGRLRLLGMQRETNSVCPVEVTEQALTCQRQEGYY